MTVDNVKFNLFSQSRGIEALKGVQAQGGSPVNGVGTAGASQALLKTDNKYGVGLVNSDLNEMSYRLPNGKTTCCNTFGIA